MITSDNMQRCQDYIQALEEERRKIQVFQRELPLCLELVAQAIEACKQQLPGTSTTSEYDLHHKQSECNSEQTSSDDAPVLEEFIPIKRSNSSHHNNSDDDEVHESKKFKKDDDCEDNLKSNSNGGVDKHSKKSDWLRSAQLWNQTPDPPTKKVSSTRKVPVVEVKRSGSGGAFHPFKKENSNNNNNNNVDNYVATINSPQPPASTSSTAETGGTSGGGNKKEVKDEQSQRKARRCWSPELHKRFLQALHQLGGSHVATPKQIRELMKVDGLTNDEVKSHLQKYRLHTRRPSGPSTQTNHNVQTPQFVVVGGIWVQPEYASMPAATTANSGEASGNGIYAPIPKLPPPFQETSKPSPKDNNDVITPSSNSGNNTEENVQSHSPATSSSTHTTTASPAY